MAERDNAIQTLLERLTAEYGGDPNIRTIGFGLRDRGGTLVRPSGSSSSTSPQGTARQAD